MELIASRIEIENIDFIFVRCKEGIFIPKEYVYIYSNWVLLLFHNCGSGLISIPGSVQGHLTVSC